SDEVVASADEERRLFRARREMDRVELVRYLAPDEARADVRARLDPAVDRAQDGHDGVAEAEVAEVPVIDVVAGLEVVDRPAEIARPGDDQIPGPRRHRRRAADVPFEGPLVDEKEHGAADARQKVHEA